MKDCGVEKIIENNYKKPCEINLLPVISYFKSEFKQYKLKS